MREAFRHSIVNFFAERLRDSKPTSRRSTCSFMRSAFGPIVEWTPRHRRRPGRSRPSTSASWAVNSSCLVTTLVDASGVALQEQTLGVSGRNRCACAGREGPRGPRFLAPGRLTADSHMFNSPSPLRSWQSVPHQADCRPSAWRTTASSDCATAGSHLILYLNRF